MGRRNEGRKKSRKKERVNIRHKERNDGRKEAHSREFFFFLLNSNPRKLCTQAPRFLLLKPEGKPRCCVNYRKNQ